MRPNGGSVQMTKTDNSTYGARKLGFFDIKYNWSAIPTKPEMDWETKVRLRKHFVKLGYRDKNL